MKKLNHQVLRLFVFGIVKGQMADFLASSQSHQKNQKDQTEKSFLTDGNARLGIIPHVQVKSRS